MNFNPIGTMKSFLNKRGYSVAFMGSSALALIVAAITIVIGARVVSQVQTLETVNTTAYNVSSSALTALGSYGDWFVIIVLVIIAVIVIGLLQHIRAVAGE